MLSSSSSTTSRSHSGISDADSGARLRRGQSLSFGGRRQAGVGPRTINRTGHPSPARTRAPDPQPRRRPSRCRSSTPFVWARSSGCANHRACSGSSDFFSFGRVADFHHQSALCWAAARRFFAVWLYAPPGEQHIIQLSAFDEVNASATRHDPFLCSGSHRTCSIVLLFAGFSSRARHTPPPRKSRTARLWTTRWGSQLCSTGSRRGRPRLQRPTPPRDVIRQIYR